MLVKCMYIYACCCVYVHRSYSTLSIGSTRSSLASELQEIPNAPSIVSNSEQPDQLVSEQSEVRAHSPSMLEESLQTPVEIKIESEETPMGTTTESLTVADLEDSEFGGFISISNGNPNPDTIQATATEHEQSTVLPQVIDSSIKSEHSGVLSHVDDSQEQPVPGTHASLENIDEHLATSIDHPRSATEALSNSPVGVESEHTIPPGLGNNTHTDGYTPSPSPVKGDRKAKSPVIDRLSLKKTKTREKPGKKVSKKESQKKTKKSRNKTEYIDDNQSEISYQPDTDLSRSRTAKKINGKLIV